MYYLVPIALYLALLPYTLKLFFFLISTINLTSVDVYDAIPTIVTTFVAIIAKVSIFIFLLELVHYTSNYFIEGLS